MIEGFGDLPLTDHYARGARKVVFHANGGYKSEQEYAKRFLEVGAIYEVEAQVMSGWSTELYLLGVDKAGFNSTMFEDVDG